MSLSTDTNRIFGLDIYRAVAIIIVVLAHGNFIIEGTILEGFPYFRFIDGVDMFFVLSGYLIGGILLKIITKPAPFSIVALVSFWKRRWLRTLPNYYLVLLCNYFVVSQGIIKEDIEQFNFHFFTFTQNFAGPFYGFFWESWSLSIEEWFYIFSPILIFILVKKTTAKNAFLLTVLLMIILPLLYRISIYDPNIDRFTWDITFRKTVLCRLDSIGYGLLFAWVNKYYFSAWKKWSIPTFVIGMAFIVFILKFKMAPNTFYKQTFYFSLVPFSAVLLIPLASRWKSASGLLPFAVQHISKISYSMYLINLALVAEVIRDNFDPTGGWDSLSKYGLYWFVVVVASTMLYRFFEKPIMNMREAQKS